MRLLSLLLVVVSLLFTGCSGESWPPPVEEMSGEAPVLSPDQALEQFYLPPGYDIELVASEPMVVDPVAIDFDADGRMWVVEMRSYMPNLQGEGEQQPNGRIVVLEDTNHDGQMDQHTVYLDSLVLPRSIEVLEDGVLVAEVPNLWFTRDTDGDLQADTRELVRDDYGNPNSNPEHNANGLLWGMDNWIHNADYDGRFQYRNGRFEYGPYVDHGQWGISMDDYGRMYLNSNSDPLRMDLLDAHYYTRNPDMMRRRGLYYDLVEDETVWPARPTPGINRGYRPGMLRDDSTLTRFTAAGSPVVFRGDRLPDELHGDVFVSEPSGNLVRRFKVSEEDGGYRAYNPYAEEQAEFLTSTDERFRPVNFYSAPDGTIYVVDMYRGIIQHSYYITDYLTRQIRRRDLDEPVGLGRIYRIVHKSTERGERPRLREKSSEELVSVLSHPNGWWRDTAQRLIVERGDTSAVPRLRETIASAEDPRTRLHALWTLDGLGVADADDVVQGLTDSSPQVRAAAIRISEEWLSSGDPQLTDKVLHRVDDESRIVRRQLAASLGALPESRRMEAVADLLVRRGDDPVVVDAAITGLHGLELAFLRQMIEQTGSSKRAAASDEPLEMLAAAIMNSGETDRMQELISWLADNDLARPQKLALLDGIERFAPEIDEDSGEAEQAELPREPQGLLAAAASDDSLISARAHSLSKRFYWPGKPQRTREPQVEPLTPAEKERFAQGRELYEGVCAPCHQQDGRGQDDGAASLVGSRWVVNEPEHVVRIVVQGKEGDNLMPPVPALSDEQVAAVATYIRRAWENSASAVDPAFVDSVRQEIQGRERPWTAPELRDAAE